MLKCINCGDSLGADTYNELNKKRPKCFCDHGHNVVNLQNARILDIARYQRNQNYWEWLDNTNNFKFTSEELVDRENRRQECKKLLKED